MAQPCPECNGTGEERNRAWTRAHWGRLVRQIGPENPLTLARKRREFTDKYGPELLPCLGCQCPQGRPVYAPRRHRQPERCRR